MAQQYDFTDQLQATLPSIPRPHLVKFNNSWLYWAQTGRDYDFLVVYRAMAHHPFAARAPTLPGQDGTPWAAAWARAAGDAELEGQIPAAGRTGRYFDGIGVATLRCTLGDNDVINRIQCPYDTILPNSDGYEDPRIFRVGGKLYIHSHRYHPDQCRAALEPEHQVYGGYTPARIPVSLTVNNQGLFVKINELIRDGNQFRLGPSYFYGTNVSVHHEKNYGFFEDNGALNAIYGVAPSGRPFTILRSVGAAVGQELLRFPRSNVVVCEEFQPNTGYDTDCFLRLYRFYNELVPRSEIIVFSSSGPLLFFDNLWQGVGHVKILHARVAAYTLQLTQFVLDIANHHGANFGTDLGRAMSAFKDNANGLRDNIVQFSKQNRDSMTSYIVNFVNAIQPNNQIQNQAVTDVDKQRFSGALEANFFNLPLTKFVNMMYGQPHAAYWRNNPTPNPYNENKIIFHPQCFYLTFVYKLQATNYRLSRFSHAFLVFDRNSPKMLQFASNLAPLASGVLIGFGEDDNRAKVLAMSGPEFHGLHVHDASNFDPQNYDFLPVNSNEVRLN